MLAFGVSKEVKVKKLYVGNLPFSATEDEVRDLFANHGTVGEVTLIRDRETGRLRGFGFVEMEDDDVDPIISALDGTDFGGRNLNVNIAKEPKDRGGRRERRSRW